MLTQDVDSHHLQLLLSYMYRGQVIIIITIVIINMIVVLHLHSFCTHYFFFFDLSYRLISNLCQVDVEEHELGGFLKTATGLQIKGLSDDQGGQVGRIRQSSLIRHVENPKVEQIHRLIVQHAHKHEPDEKKVLKSPEKRVQHPSSQVGVLRPAPKSDGT